MPRWRSIAVGGLLLFGAMAAVLVLRDRRTESPPRMQNQSTERINSELANAVIALEAREQELRDTLWRPEILAQECGRTVEELWDALNRSTNKLQTAGSFELGEITIGNLNLTNLWAHGFVETTSTGKGVRVDWQELLRKSASNGWVLEQCEFAHHQFATNSARGSRQSKYEISAHLENAEGAQWLSLEGDVIIDWGETANESGLIPISAVDATNLKTKWRRGPTLFQTEARIEVEPLENSHRIDPLILYDLDRDGISEILLVARNILFRRRGEQYIQEALFSKPPASVSTAVVDDLTRDGLVDLLCENAKGLLLFEGNSKGAFETAARVVFGSRDLVSPSVLTCGDIDLDGDLDIFLGQYREPYDGGATPFPYYDANNGYPAYLLINDGRGNFRDGTIEAGLGSKRFRRIFSSSFVDLDGDARSEE